MLLPFANSPRFRIEALSTDACLLVARRRKVNTADDGGDVQLVEINGARLAYRIAGPADAPAGSPRCMAAAAWVRVTLCTAFPGCVAPLSLSTLGSSCIPRQGFRRQPAADGAPSTTRGGRERGLCSYVRRLTYTAVTAPTFKPTAHSPSPADPSGGGSGGGYRVLSFDYRGRGRSSANQALRLCADRRRYRGAPRSLRRVGRPRGGGVRSSSAAGSLAGSWLCIARPGTRTGWGAFGVERGDGELAS